MSGVKLTKRPMAYDQQTRDLAHLAAKRTSDAITSVVQICDGPDQALQVALMAAGTAMGAAAGTISAKYGCSYEEAKALLPNLLLTPLPTKTEGGE